MNARILVGMVVLAPLALLADGITGEGAQGKKVRLFILSGQSNMARLDPDASFSPAVRKAFPEDEVIVVKSAQGGQPIRRWLKNYKAPDDPTIKKAKGETMPGDLYDVLMKSVKSALKDKKPDSIAFVWMQGEADAQRGPAGLYEASLRGLIKQLRDDLGRPDIAVVIGRLTDYKSGTAGWDTVRAAQVKVATEDPLAAWVDTDDINGVQKNLHHTKAGYEILGRRFAQKAVELLGKAR